MGSTDPAEIRKVDPRTLAILWQDDHLSSYPVSLLRRICQCAICKELPPSVSDSLTYDSVSLVGRYALNFRFSDGHETGIYPFEFLRASCPCAACSAA